MYCKKSALRAGLESCALEQDGDGTAGIIQRGAGLLAPRE